MKNVSIGAVVVTFNRIEKLKIALESYENQLVKPSYIIVINNASSDGTKEYLKAWSEEKAEYEKIVVNLLENIGGSGGFYEGQKLALEKEADWVMVADDDAYLANDYIASITKFLENNEDDDYSVVSGAVIQAGTKCNVHRSLLRSKYSWRVNKFVPSEYYSKSAFLFDLTSYVGPVFNISKMKVAGLVNKDYFIWDDDFEHSLRMRKVGKFVCIPSACIYHDDDGAYFGLSWKNYYGTRNRIDLLKKHFKVRFPFLLLVYILRALLCPLQGKSFIEVKMKLIAIKDGLFGNLGTHLIYRPGWKP